MSCMFKRLDRLVACIAMLTSEIWPLACSWCVLSVGAFSGFVLSLGQLQHLQVQQAQAGACCSSYDLVSFGTQQF
jgi:hypothetical protein